MTSRSLRPALVVAVLGAAVLTGGAGKSTSSSASSPSSVPSSPTPAPTDAASPSAVSPTPAKPAVDQTIRITYAGGKVVGGPQLVKVKQNSSVALVVTSDVADEVHFHGYDKSAD